MPPYQTADQFSHMKELAGRRKSTIEPKVRDGGRNTRNEGADVTSWPLCLSIEQIESLKVPSSAFIGCYLGGRMIHRCDQTNGTPNTELSRLAE